MYFPTVQMYRVDTGYCISRVYTKYWILDTVSSITVKLFTSKTRFLLKVLAAPYFSPCLS